MSDFRESRGAATEGWGAAELGCAGRPQAEPSPASLRLLLFAVGGVRFGIDADQVEGVTTYRGEQADDLFWFHEELAYGGMPVRYHAPTVLAIRTGTEQSYRVIIDAMEDIVEVSHDAMACFPPMLESFALRRGMWGVWWRPGAMTVLLDFLRLLPEQPANHPDH